MRVELESISRAPSIAAAATSGSEFANQWQRILFEAERCWPKNTAKKLAGITGAGVRTCYRWLAYGAQPSSKRTLAILAELKREHAERGAWLEQFELDLR